MDFCFNVCRNIINGKIVFFYVGNLMSNFLIYIYMEYIGKYIYGGEKVFNIIGFF